MKMKVKYSALCVDIMFSRVKLWISFMRTTQVSLEHVSLRKVHLKFVFINSIKFLF